MYFLFFSRKKKKEPKKKVLFLSPVRAARFLYARSNRRPPLGPLLFPTLQHYRALRLRDGRKLPALTGCNYKLAK